jgi:hypothetical protein
LLTLPRLLPSFVVFLFDTFSPSDDITRPSGPPAYEPLSAESYFSIAAASAMFAMSPPIRRSPPDAVSRHRCSTHAAIAATLPAASRRDATRRRLPVQADIFVRPAVALCHRRHECRYWSDIIRL